MHFTTLTAATLIGLAAAKNIAIQVGTGGELTYGPNMTVADKDDTVEFVFTGSSHSVVQSSFDKPCEPLAGGWHVPTQSKANATFTVKIENTDPMWFYCSVSNHCKSGMVGVINAPSDKTITDFQAAAKSASSSGAAPSGVVGGTLTVDGQTTVGAPASGSNSTNSSSTSTGSKPSGTSSSGGSSSGSPAPNSAVVSAVPAALILVGGAVAMFL